jgi:hypothetical protein
MARHAVHRRIAGATGLWPALVAPLFLAACLGGGASGTPPEAGRRDFTADLIPATDGETAPADRPGACFAREETPAVIETVTEQVQVTPETRNVYGEVTQPATYASHTEARVVSERRAVWIETPCPPALTADFLASLQRALKARGYYLDEVTGAWSAATADAVRRYQSDNGLESSVLSMAAARGLGLIAVDRETLE